MSHWGFVSEQLMHEDEAARLWRISQAKATRRRRWWQRTTGESVAAEPRVPALPVLQPPSVVVTDLTDKAAAAMPDMPVLPQQLTPAQAEERSRSLVDERAQVPKG